MADQKVLNLNVAKKIAIVAAGLVAVALPILVGVGHPASASAQAAERPRFASVEIRPSNNCEESGTVALRTKPDRKRKGGDEGAGILRVRCATFGGDEGLIHQAYVVFASGEVSFRVPSPSLIGGPDWLASETFDIEATADGNPSGEMMRGPMMQTLLEEKLNLKLRRETRDSPAYALVAAEPSSRLRDFHQGSCIPLDLSRSLPVRSTPGVEQCSFFVGSTPTRESIPKVIANGATLGDFAKLLTMAMDRPVVDATGIAGRFDLSFEFAPDGNTPRLVGLGPENMTRPVLSKAIQEQHGLKLVPSATPREFLVIDRVERPVAK